MSKFVKFSEKAGNNESSIYMSRLLKVEPDTFYKVTHTGMDSFTILNEEGKDIEVLASDVASCGCEVETTYRTVSNFQEGMKLLLLKPFPYLTVGEVYEVFENMDNTTLILDDDGDTMRTRRFNMKDDFRVVAFKTNNKFMGVSEPVNTFREVQVGDVLVPLEDDDDLTAGGQYIITRVGRDSVTILDDEGDEQMMGTFDSNFQIFKSPIRGLDEISTGNRINNGDIAQCTESHDGFIKGHFYKVEGKGTNLHLVSECGNICLSRLNFKFYKKPSEDSVVVGFEEIQEDEHASPEVGDKVFFKNTPFTPAIEITLGKHYTVVSITLEGGCLGFLDDSGDFRVLSNFRASTYTVIKNKSEDKESSAKEDEEEWDIYLAVSSPFFTKNSLVRKVEGRCGGVYELIEGGCIYNNGRDNTPGAYDTHLNFVKLVPEGSEEAATKSGGEFLTKIKAKTVEASRELREVLDKAEELQSSLDSLEFELEQEQRK